jgi:hypothetical protein
VPDFADANEVNRLGIGLGSRIARRNRRPAAAATERGDEIGSLAR